ncbi:MAG: D-alanyl-D-alanine carboxypeptidase [Candidatus Levybacteria bacterium]|nr:D-alanyl-D-alanine carboxypeptidase [Candidatus Levybacteria bacterium]
MNSFLEKIEKLNWQIFFVGVIIGMIAVFLLKISNGVHSLLNPIGANIETENNNIFKSVLPKLAKKQNFYALKPLKENFIPYAYANKFDIPVNAYIVTDFDSGEILAEKESAKRFPIASLTKIMTAVVALDLAVESEVFTVSKNASSMPPTKIGVVPKEKMTLKELLNAALLTSANDATEVIKEGIDGKYNDKVFIKAMNEKAKILGLKDTSFTNPQGFDNKKNYSSAKDFAILSHYALTNYSLLAEIVKKDYEFLPKDNNHKQFDLYNWNGLLDVYPNVFGLKIGNTGNALHTISIASRRENKIVLVILLGAPGVLERDLWAAQLLDSGFEKLGNLPKIGVTSDMLTQKYSTWKYFN